MGIIRTLLAYAVVLEHLGAAILGSPMVGGAIAVRSFYLISGFYMALILNEKYAPGGKSYWVFLSNRLLKLLPVYWAMLALHVALCIAGRAMIGNGQALDEFITHLPEMQPWTAFYLLTSTLTLVGLDWFFLLGYASDGSVVSIANFAKSPNSFAHFLFLPQAWTIGIELSFYFIAPFLARTHLLVVLAVAAGGLWARSMVIDAGLTQDPWAYRFFPLELPFFCAGIAAYALYRNVKNHGAIPLLGPVVLTMVVVATVGFGWVRAQLGASSALAYYALIFAATPILFAYSHRQRFDRALAELSYPVYMSHMAAIYVASHAPLAVIREHKVAVVLIGTTVISILCYRFIAEPIDRYRQRRIPTD